MFFSTRDRRVKPNKDGGATLVLAHSQASGVGSALRMGHMGGDLVCLEALPQPGLACGVPRCNCFTPRTWG